MLLQNCVQEVAYTKHISFRTIIPFSDIRATSIYHSLLIMFMRIKNLPFDFNLSVIHFCLLSSCNSLLNLWYLWEHAISDTNDVEIGGTCLINDENVNNDKRSGRICFNERKFGACNRKKIKENRRFILMSLSLYFLQIWYSLLPEIMTEKL